MINKLTLLLALLALLNGIVDAARLSGFGLGSLDPMQVFTVSGFAVLGSFAIARIISGVGMWIKSNWGTPLLFGTTIIELSIYLSGLASLDIGLLGFVSRLLQLAGSMFILVLLYKTWQAGKHE